MEAKPGLPEHVRSNAGLGRAAQEWYSQTFYYIPRREMNWDAETRSTYVRFDAELLAVDSHLEYCDLYANLKFLPSEPEFLCSISHLRWISGLGF